MISVTEAEMTSHLYQTNITSTNCIIIMMWCTLYQHFKFTQNYTSNTMEYMVWTAFSSHYQLNPLSAQQAKKLDNNTTRN